MPFTPIQTFLGGYLLHLSSSSLLEDTGRVFGISGILNSSLFGTQELWQPSTIVGLLAGPVLSHITGLETYFPGDGLASIAQVSYGRLALAGGLVGFGTRLGSGCTSGHMLCGVSRLSPRSIVATFTFFTTAVLTANISPLSTSSSAVPANRLDKPSSSTIALFITVIAGCKLAYSVLRQTLLNTKTTSRVLRSAPYFLLGLIFSLGLSISGMADPLKVMGFLRFPRLQHFDPSLSMVMLSGVLPNAIHYATIKNKTPRPKFSWESWQIPTRKDIDIKLIIGAVAFGAGWGLVGLCPGPAIVTLAQGFVKLTQDSSFQIDNLGKVTTFMFTTIVAMRISSLVSSK
ncbi:uncharacterized protein L201_001270 [Kwoniella dendrophila CBS 6074]|uniref:Sulphur transport domain-containing protein n=1 Tax=Kwoniella dendrophila CBS 6074 TaxID=1295534 RepID=A0AAX4JNS9_9TREE